MAWGSERRAILGWRCLLDLLALATMAIVVAVLQGITPFQRGFFCNDETIVYPFKPSTISSAVAGIVSAFAPLMLFAFGSYRLSFAEAWRTPRSEMELFHKKLSVPPYIVHFIHFAFVFVLGGLLNQLVTDVGKVTVGRLRPNFISVCQPNYTAFNCTNANSVPQYVLGDFCTAGKEHVEDSRKSWPSGHSSTSTYCAVYAVLYIEYCYIFRRIPGVRSLLNLIFILFAFLTVLSRIDDNKHHWSDVLSGSLIGVGVAVSMFWANFPLRDRVEYLRGGADDTLPHAMYQSVELVVATNTQSLDAPPADADRPVLNESA